MDFASTIFLLLLVMLPFSSIVRSDPLVSAVITFGDSNVDIGNNNKLPTIVKAIFPPYGRDFVTHRPTGRFSNGKLAIDFIVESLGFSSLPPPYLSQEASGKNLLIGCNFASAGSGYSNVISESYGSIPLIQQLQYYKEYQAKMVDLVGEAEANEILSDTIFILSAGGTDFLSYFINPLLNKAIPPDEFTNILVTSYSNFIESLNALGARKIGVTSLSPIGCLPAMMTVFGSNQCIAIVNQVVISFNMKLNRASEGLRSRLPGLRLIVLDTYHPLLDTIKRPAIYGFSETRRGCCGLGLLGFSSLLCNPKSAGTCSNATNYVFWDAIHVTEAVHKIIASNLLVQGAPLIP